jgi:hypothetical protein
LAVGQRLARVEGQRRVGVGAGPVEGVGTVAVPARANVRLRTQSIQLGIVGCVLQGGIQIFNGLVPAVELQREAPTLTPCLHGARLEANRLGAFRPGPVGVPLLESGAALGKVRGGAPHVVGDTLEPILSPISTSGEKSMILREPSKFLDRPARSRRPGGVLL